MKAKVAFLAKVDREKRNQERQRQQFMTPDELKRAVEEQNQQLKLQKVLRHCLLVILFLYCLSPHYKSLLYYCLFLF